MMDVRNRMANVAKLRCNICQEYIRMKLKDGWQQELYMEAKKQVDHNGSYRDIYIGAYNKMREYEVENYRVEDMDVTLINGLVNHPRFKGMDIVASEVKKAMSLLKADRNAQNHSGENEEADELYLLGLLALVDLRAFVNAVDRDNYIPDENRRGFRQKNMQEINALIDLLDEERIELIQQEKAFDKDIQMVLDSEDRDSAWRNLHIKYFERFEIEDTDWETRCRFYVRAANAGIIDAYDAAIITLWGLKRYKEAEELLSKLCHLNELTDDRVQYILKIINNIIVGCEGPIEEMQEIIHFIASQGFRVTRPEGEGYTIESCINQNNEENKV